MGVNRWWHDLPQASQNYLWDESQGHYIAFSSHFGTDRSHTGSSREHTGESLTINSGIRWGGYDLLDLAWVLPLHFGKRATGPSRSTSSDLLSCRNWPSPPCRMCLRGIAWLRRIQRPWHLWIYRREQGFVRLDWFSKTILTTSLVQDCGNSTTFCSFFCMEMCLTSYFKPNSSKRIEIL